MPPTDHSWELIDLESTATTENKAVLSAAFFASAVFLAGFLLSLCFLGDGILEHSISQGVVPTNFVCLHLQNLCHLVTATVSRPLRLFFVCEKCF